MAFKSAIKTLFLYNRTILRYLHNQKLYAIILTNYIYPTLIFDYILTRLPKFSTKEHADSKETNLSCAEYLFINIYT